MRGNRNHIVYARQRPVEGQGGGVAYYTGFTTRCGLRTLSADVARRWEHRKGFLCGTCHRVGARPKRARPEGAW